MAPSDSAETSSPCPQFVSASVPLSDSRAFGKASTPRRRCRSGAVLLVGNLFHPIDHFSILDFLNAICVMAVFGPAPCQCFSPGANQMTSPGLISSTGPPRRCTRPRPDVTSSVWPRGGCARRFAPLVQTSPELLGPVRVEAVEERVNPYRAREPVGRPFARGRRARADDFHVCVSIAGRSAQPPQRSDQSRPIALP